MTGELSGQGQGLDHTVDGGSQQLSLMSNMPMQSQPKFGSDDVDEGDEDVEHDFLQMAPHVAPKKYQQLPAHKAMPQPDLDDEQVEQLDHQQLEGRLHFEEDEDLEQK